MVEIGYSWSIGNNTNNMVEAHAFWQGLKQLETLGIDEVSIFGDPRMLIQALNTSAKIRNLKLAHLIKRIQLLPRSFRKIDFFHILRTINTEADKADNKATLLNNGDCMSIMMFGGPTFPKAIAQARMDAMHTCSIHQWGSAWTGGVLWGLS